MISEYETDFYQWLGNQARALRARAGEALDWDNLAEEIEDMARSQNRALVSHLRVLFIHLIKWRMQPEHRSRSWRGSINEARDQIADLLEQSPSLKHKLDEAVLSAYARARRIAADEMQLLSADQVASDCPWTFEQAMNEDFLTAGL